MSFSLLISLSIVDASQPSTMSSLDFKQGSKKTNFSLVHCGSALQNHTSLFQSSVLVFFEVNGLGIGFPIHVFIVNLVLSASVSLIIFFLLLEVTVISSVNQHPFPGKLYCLTFVEGSLLIEFTAQLIHVIGSILLIFGASKRSRILCYMYVLCSMLSFITSTIIRTAQVFLCEKKQHPQMLPLKYRPDLPEYFKLILMWLICQLFWYWLVFSFVVAQLEWFKTLKVEEDMVSNKIPDTPAGRSLK